MKPDDYEVHYREFVDHIDRLAYVDMGIHLGIFTSEQIAHIPQYIARYGVTSFKFFMSYKGEEGTKRGVGDVDDGLLLELMTKLAGIPGTIANVHAENIEMIWRAEDRVRAAGTDGLAAHNDCRPGLTEAAAMVTAAYVARATGCPLYLVHMSSKEAAQEIRRILPGRHGHLRRDHPALPFAHGRLGLRAAGQGQPAGADERRRRGPVGRRGRWPHRHRRQRPLGPLPLGQGGRRLVRRGRVSRASARCCRSC